MRKNLLAVWLLGVAVSFLTGCNPQEEEDTFVPDVNWKPSYETLDALEPMVVSAKTFTRLVAGKTWVEAIYACSDSLESLIIWDCYYNVPNNDLLTGMYYHEWSGWLWPMYQFDVEDNIMLANQDIREWNYYYNEVNGTLALAIYPIEKSKDVVGSRILMMITDKYIVWRENSASRFLPWSNATYTLYVWTVEEEKKER